MKIRFFAVAGFIYIVEFLSCVSSCNLYSDVTRKSICNYPNSNKTIVYPDSSAVYDLSIKLTGIYHIITFLRTSLLLTIVSFGDNLMQIWYISGILAFIYGIASFIYLHMVYLSDKGKICSAAQKTRYNGLLIEIIYFWVCFFVFQFPILIIFCSRNPRKKIDMILVKDLEEK